MNSRTAKAAFVPIVLITGALIGPPSGSAHAEKTSPVCTQKQSTSLAAAYAKWQKTNKTPTSKEQIAELTKLAKAFNCEPRG
jgi:hypothetical protein